MVFETKNEDEEEEGGSEEEWRGGGGSRVFGSAEGQADYIITGGWVCVPHPRGFRSGESLLSLSLSLRRCAIVGGVPFRCVIDP